MTFDEFYSNHYLPHADENVRETPLYGGGYEIKYENGDVYQYEEKLKPGRTPGFNGHYDMDDFDCRSTFNGEEILPQRS